MHNATNYPYFVLQSTLNQPAPMKTDHDYINDIAEIRAMMERSSKFLSLSGLSGILAGLYALLGAYIAYDMLGFNPDALAYTPPSTGTATSSITAIIMLGSAILILALATAIGFSRSKAAKIGESIWNPTSRRLVAHMAVPLVAGGLLSLILISHNLIGLLAPTTLIFYGIALVNASKFTLNEVKYLGITQLILGLAGAYFIAHAFLLWAVGFGIVHIGYGLYVHIRYER